MSLSNKLKIFTYYISNDTYWLLRYFIKPFYDFFIARNPLDPADNVNNISFQCLERTPISVDILLLESTLLPGTRILVDERTNNVRFLKNNLKRKFKFKWDRFGDVIHIILAEKKLGKLNKLELNFINSTT